MTHGCLLGIVAVTLLVVVAVENAQARRREGPFRGPPGNDMDDDEGDYEDDLDEQSLEDEEEDEVDFPPRPYMNEGPESGEPSGREAFGDPDEAGLERDTPEEEEDDPEEDAPFGFKPYRGFRRDRYDKYTGDDDDMDDEDIPIEEGDGDARYRMFDEDDEDMGYERYHRGGYPYRDGYDRRYPNRDRFGGYPRNQGRRYNGNMQSGRNGRGFSMRRGGYPMNRGMGNNRMDQGRRNYQMNRGMRNGGYPMNRGRGYGGYRGMGNGRYGGNPMNRGMRNGGYPQGGFNRYRGSSGQNGPGMGINADAVRSLLMKIISAEQSGNEGKSHKKKDL